MSKFHKWFKEKSAAQRFFLTVLLCFTFAGAAYAATSIWGATDRAPATGTMRLPVDTGAASTAGYLEVDDIDTYIASTTQTLTNKTFDANGTGNSLSNVDTADATSTTGSDTTFATGTAGTNGNVAIWNADGDLVDGATVDANILVDGDIGGSVQAFDAVLDDLSALSVIADNEIIVGTGAGTYANEGGATARTSLGLAIGTDVQAEDAVLTDLAALSAVADNEVIVGTGAGTYAHESGNTLRVSLGLAIGSDVQAFDANNALTDVAQEYTAQQSFNATTLTALGADLVTNGGFATDTGWTKGTGWTIGSGVADSDASQVADSDLTETTLALVNGNTYEITFSVTNYVAGNVTAVAGGTEGTDRAANGTFTENIIAGAGADLDIRADLDFDGNIDDVIVKLANVSWDLNTNQVTTLTLDGDLVLNNPTNQVDGSTYIIRPRQDGTGTRLLTYGSVYKFPGGTAPTLTTAASSKDIITCISDGTNMECVFQGDFK